MPRSGALAGDSLLEASRGFGGRVFPVASKEKSLLEGRGRLL